MYTDRITAPKVTPSAGTGGLVRTHETVAMFEVGVPVPLDLPEIRVPVVTVSDPAKNRHLPTEASDRPTIAVSVIAAASSIGAAPVVLEDSVASAGLQKQCLHDALNRHVGGVLTRISPKTTEGDRRMHAERWRNGT